VSRLVSFTIQDLTHLEEIAIISDEKSSESLFTGSSTLANVAMSTSASS
jgi:hypothetical protein